MKHSARFAAFALFAVMTVPAFAQRTDEHLKPSDYKGKRQEMKFVSVDIFSIEDFKPEVEVREDVCWGEKVSPSFEESYEIQCKYNPESKLFRLELMVENQDKPHTLEIDGDLAYQIGTLIDAAVLSANNLPAREWMQQRVDALKNPDGGVMAIVSGLDGTTFHFFNFNCGAQCWSPGSGNNKELVSIGEALYDAIAHQDLEPVRALLPKIKSLAGSYASLLQDPYREYFMLRLDRKPDGKWSWWRDLPL